MSSKYLYDFPEELWTEIFIYTDAYTMLNISFINPYFCKLIKDNILHVAISNNTIVPWSLYSKPIVRNIDLDYTQLISIAKIEHINYHTKKLKNICPYYTYNDLVKLPKYLLNTIYSVVYLLRTSDATNPYLYSMTCWEKPQLIALWYVHDRQLDIKQLFKVIDMYSNIEALYMIRLLQHNITDINILYNVYQYNDDDIDKIIGIKK